MRVGCGCCVGFETCSIGELGKERSSPESQLALLQSLFHVIRSIYGPLMVKEYSATTIRGTVQSFVTSETHLFGEGAQAAGYSDEALLSQQHFVSRLQNTLRCLPETGTVIVFRLPVQLSIFRGSTAHIM